MIGEGFRVWNARQFWLDADKALFYKAVPLLLSGQSIIEGADLHPRKFSPMNNRSKVLFYEVEPLIALW